jgi:hypothetical protein
MKRSILRIASALSLLMCVGMCALWWRSVSRYDLVEYDPPSHRLGIDLVSSNGVLAYWQRKTVDLDFGLRPGTFTPSSPGGERILDLFVIFSPPQDHWWQRLGLAIRHDPPYNNDLFVTAPHWAIAAAFFLLPAVGLFGRARR